MQQLQAKSHLPVHSHLSPWSAFQGDTCLAFVSFSWSGSKDVPDAGAFAIRGIRALDLCQGSCNA